MPSQRPYHHGNLAAELIEASFGLLAEHGLAEFSVAKVARALGVSTASPYRHFADRDHLLAAVAAQAARELAGRVRDDAEAAGDDAVEAFAVTAGTYVRYVAERGAGFSIIFSPELTRLQVGELAQARRALMDLLFDLAHATGLAPTGEDALVLLERHLVAAHGYTALFDDGFFATRNPTVASIAERATQTTRTLLAGTGAGRGS
jgi:AcrR family transcriptional regulator